MYTALVFYIPATLSRFPAILSRNRPILSWNRVMLSHSFPYLSYPFLKYLTRIRLYTKFRKSPPKTTLHCQKAPVYAILAFIVLFIIYVL